MEACATRLVLLSTPLHAASEIDTVIDALKIGEMPQDDTGLRKDIPDSEQAAILLAAMARDELAKADGWEAGTRNDRGIALRGRRNNSA